MSEQAVAFDSATHRQIMGNFATGVVVVTGLSTISPWALPFSLSFLYPRIRPCGVQPSQVIVELAKNSRQRTVWHKHFG